jgi:hypothetical protein
MKNAGPGLGFHLVAKKYFGMPGTFPGVACEASKVGGAAEAVSPAELFCVKSH